MRVSPAGNFVAFQKFGPCFYKFLNHISQLKLISYEISKIRLFGPTILETIHFDQMSTQIPV